ncbi:Early meiotic induction protein 1 [Tolypocladium capitatum]|uniref:Early meiotic induction protein 1 n=1 Tax=Tolypocladium capitatum TaxID=45235 RepID=A0A2K3QJU6_9HYPO|nr:Early meiotic induction protein 1 [Tolypocladium capitatum]
MGWLWASTSAPKPPEPTPQQTTPKPSSVQNAAPNEPIDAEIQKFLDLFKNDDTAAPNSSSAAPPTSSPQEQSSASSISSWLLLKASPKATPPPPSAPPGDALSEALLPTEMSCRQAFDLAWSCNSLGGQFNSVYRYGSMRSCSEHWDDFWFCMRTRSYTDDLKENMIRAHYRDKDHRKYGPGRPSSEDVWESRGQKMRPGTAFAETVDAPVVSDDEWRKTETERRRGVRQGLGYDNKAS